MILKTNTFQKSMLLWNSIHPYNAVHLVKIPFQQDKQTVEDTLKSVINAVLPGPVSVTEDRFILHEDNDPKLPVRWISHKSGETFQTLEKEITKELNTPFEGERFSPFRFLCLKDGEYLYTGMTYFHPFLDASSASAIMEAVTISFMEGNPTHVDMDFPTPLRPRMFPILLKTLKTIPSLPAQIRKVRRYRRPPKPAGSGALNRFLFIQCDANSLLSSLRSASKRYGVTINDLLMGCLALSLRPAWNKKPITGRRRNLAIQSIADIRGDLNIPRNTPGVFLSAFSVSVPIDEAKEIGDVLKTINRQTASIKRQGDHYSSLLGLFISNLLIKWFFSRKKEKFYSKYYPHWGGITNLNLNALWKEAGKMPAQYHRAVSTGPVVPVVMSATTLGDRLTLGVSIRTDIFNDDDIKNIGESIQEVIDALH